MNDRFVAWPLVPYGRHSLDGHNNLSQFIEKLTFFAPACVINDRELVAAI